MPLASLLLLAALAEDPVPPADSEVPVADIAVEAEHFDCLSKGTQVARSWYSSLTGRQETVVAIAQGKAPGPYPVGTVVQLFPGEAMVKRGPGFSPDTDDWEFLKIAVKGQDTIILERGTTDIKNIGGTCAGCHAPARQDHDWVCAEGHGCKPLPGFVVKKALKLTAKDPRCSE